MEKLRNVPNLVKGWACPNCKKIYHHNEPGKNFASACCKCILCKINYSAYTGLNNICEKCHLEKNIKQWEESIQRMQKELENMKQDLGRINRGK